MSSLMLWAKGFFLFRFPKVFIRATVCRHLVRVRSYKIERVFLTPDFCKKCARRPVHFMGIMG